MYKRQSSGHLYLTWIPGISLEQRQEIIVKMAEAGVACNVHYKPLPMMTAYKNMGFDIKDYPNAYGHFVNEIKMCIRDSAITMRNSRSKFRMDIGKYVLRQKSTAGIAWGGRGFCH